MTVGDLIRERRAADGRRLTPLQIRLHEEHKARQARLFPFKPKGYCPPLAPANDPAPVIATAAVGPEPPAFKRPWFTIEHDEPMPGLVPGGIRDIQNKVCRHFNISLNDLFSQRRSADIVLPRHLAIFLCKTLTRRSFPEIGRRFGGRDHSTALNSCRRAEKIIASNPEIAAVVETLKQQLVKA